MSITPNLTNREWVLRAACRGLDTELFFPPDRARGPNREKYIHAAQQICRTCPVRGECGTYAKQTGATHGIWGGKEHTPIHQPRDPAWSNTGYTRPCAGGCGNTVATPSAMQPGYKPIGAYGMCNPCYQRARRGTLDQKQRHTRVDHAEVLRLHKRGVTGESIAINVGCSPRQVARIIAKHHNQDTP